MSVTYKSPEDVLRLLRDALYICEQRVATTLYLAWQLGKSVLVEGPPGVGKTELAKTCAKTLGLPLIRLQCYEGLDEAKALYEWKYGKQLLYTQMLRDAWKGHGLQDLSTPEEAVKSLHQTGDAFFSEEFLAPRPLLQALQSEDGCVLLIDEVDKSDQEFESLLLEVLSDQQVSIPEIGTIGVKSAPPMVFLTSNNSRDLSDALKRRCLHLHIPFPDTEMEACIVRVKVPQASLELCDQLAAFMQALRQLDLRKAPAISETIDWAQTLLLLNADALDPDLVESTLNVILKHQQDIDEIIPQIPQLMAQA